MSDADRPAVASDPRVLAIVDALLAWGIGLFAMLAVIDVAFAAAAPVAVLVAYLVVGAALLAAAVALSTASPAPDWTRDAGLASFALMAMTGAVALYAEVPIARAEPLEGLDAPFRSLSLAALGGAAAVGVFTLARRRVDPVAPSRLGHLVFGWLIGLFAVSIVFVVFAPFVFVLGAAISAPAMVFWATLARFFGPAIDRNLIAFCLTVPPTTVLCLALLLGGPAFMGILGGLAALGGPASVVACAVFFALRRRRAARKNEPGQPPAP